jgi:hypothetical protein
VQELKPRVIDSLFLRPGLGAVAQR